MKVKSESEVAQSYPTLRNPMDCSLPGSSVHGIFQARVLEWGAIAFSTIFILENLYFSSLLKDNFKGYRVLVWWFFSVNTLNILVHSLLACMVYEESDVILIFASILVR